MDNTELHTLVFFGCNWCRISLLWSCLLIASIATATNWSQKVQKLFSQSYEVKITPLVIYCPRAYVYTHTHMHTHTHTLTDVPYKSDFKKLGACLDKNGK